MRVVLVQLDRIGLGHAGPKEIVEAVLVGQALQTRNGSAGPLSHTVVDGIH